MVIQVVRPLMTSVTSDESTVAGNSDREDRQLVINAALSRTRVEQMVRQFDLYGSGQAKNVNDATLALARNRMNIREEGSSGKIMVSFIDPVPGMAQRVAEHLGAIFIDGATQERSAKQEGTLTFFEQQVDYAAARLAVASEQLQRDGGASLPKRMELEVLQSSYKQLLAKREEARMARDLNSRSLGERFRALDPANLPQEPVGPTRLELTLIGGTLGLLVAWIIVTADIVRRSLKNRREFMPATN
jgi:uncharacterized protein involved in exopolysaccharide biosynthesis